jgi:cytochrome c-type biogenesis protein CcmH/NrfG
MDTPEPSLWERTPGVLLGGQRLKQEMRAFIEESLARDEADLAQHPEDSRAWHLRGTQLFRLERYQEALAAFERALALEPDNSSFAYVRKEALECCRALDTLAAAERALTDDPRDVAAWHALARALAILQRDDEALAAFDRAIEIDPANAHAYREKSRLLFYHRDEEALEAIERAIALDPTSKGVYRYKVYILLRLRRWERGIA